MEHVSPDLVDMVDAAIGETSKDITRRHWKQYDNKTVCFNPVCRKQFSALLERHHHCRRCGEIFCGSCLQFSRRLNKLAKPDPDGDWYKVCNVCFEHDQLTEGFSRSYQDEFFKLRMEFKTKAASSDQAISAPHWRSQLDIDRECHRLCRGFEQSVGSSDIKLIIHGMKNLVAPPDWMKSSMWIREELVSKCQVCSEVFSITRQRNFCRVCGIAICKSCSNEDLLIYIPDGEKQRGEVSLARLAIIRIIGCPEVEPEISWHLRICTSCRKILEERQVRAYEEATNPSVDGDFLSRLHRFFESFLPMEHKIGLHLPKYKEIIDLMEDSTRRNSSTGNVKSLAKTQVDIADLLVHYTTIIGHLKKLKPNTETQAILLQHFIRAKCDFYFNNMHVFRTMRNKLFESVTVETLEVVQRVVDKNAIIGTHVYLRLLVYETIYMCHKLKMDDVLPSFLTKIEQLVEHDVRDCIQKEKDDVDNHMTLVKEMVKEKLKEKRLKILPPSLMKHASEEVATKFMYQRVEAVLSEINNKLCLTTADRSFPASKAFFRQSIEDLQSKLVHFKIKEDMGFVLVDKLLL